MTNQENTGPESMGSYSLDEEDQLQREDTLDDRGVDDLLDEGYSPPERPLGVDAFGTTLSEQRQGENIEQRLAHEVRDPASGVAHSPEDEDLAGGSDPDDMPAASAFHGDGEDAGGRRGATQTPPEDPHQRPQTATLGREGRREGRAGESARHENADRQPRHDLGEIAGGVVRR